MSSHQESTPLVPMMNQQVDHFLPLPPQQPDEMSLRDLTEPRRPIEEDEVPEGRAGTEPDERSIAAVGSFSTSPGLSVATSASSVSVGGGQSTRNHRPEGNRRGFPPLVASTPMTFSSIPKQFPSTQEYNRIFRTLLIHAEKPAEQKKVLESTLTGLKAVLVDNSPRVLQLNLAQRNVRYYKSQVVILSLETELDDFTEPFWCRGKVVRIFQDELNQDIHVTLQLAKCLPVIPDELDTFTLREQWNPVPLNRMIAALRRFDQVQAACSLAVRSVILGNRGGPTPTPLIPKDAIPEDVNAPGLPRLNPSQAAAIKSAMTLPFALLQGPPGTGKTTTCAALVFQLHRASTACRRPRQVLCAATSNIAADHLVVSIAKTGLRVVRVTAESRNGEASDPKVEPLTLTAQVLRLLDDEAQMGNKRAEMLRRRLAEREGLRELSREQKETLHTFEQRVISRADVICATCVECGGKKLNNITFPCVLIDEASQAVEPTSLIPILRGAQQVVLAGDHKQLGPSVQSDSAEKAGFGRSLFQRLVTLRNCPLFLLQYQYRMHPEISAFPSKAFYGKLLLDGVTAKDREPRGEFPWPNASVPVVFIDTTSIKEQRNAGTFSYHSVAEARVVTTVVHHLLHSVHPDSIGVITAYSAQRQLISNQLSRFFQMMESKVEIGSVDSFQGQEKEFIVLSCVRNNEDGDVGFWKDPARLNVAITRAKRGLIVIGSKETLSNDSHWNHFLNHYDNCIVPEEKLQALFAGVFVPVIRSPEVPVSPPAQVPPEVVIEPSLRVVALALNPSSTVLFPQGPPQASSQLLYELESAMTRGQTQAVEAFLVGNPQAIEETIHGQHLLHDEPLSGAEGKPVVCFILDHSMHFGQSTLLGNDRTEHLVLVAGKIVLHLLQCKVSPRRIRVITNRSHGGQQHLFLEALRPILSSFEDWNQIEIGPLDSFHEWQCDFIVSCVNGGGKKHLPRPYLVPSARGIIFVCRTSPGEDPLCLHLRQLFEHRVVLPLCKLAILTSALAPVWGLQPQTQKTPPSVDAPTRYVCFDLNLRSRQSTQHIPAQALEAAVRFGLEISPTKKFIVKTVHFLEDMCDRWFPLGKIDHRQGEQWASRRARIPLKEWGKKTSDLIAIVQSHPVPTEPGLLAMLETLPVWYEAFRIAAISDPDGADVALLYLRQNMKDFLFPRIAWLVASCFPYTAEFNRLLLADKDALPNDACFDRLRHLRDALTDARHGESAPPTTYSSVPVPAVSRVSRKRPREEVNDEEGEIYSLDNAECNGTFSSASIPSTRIVRARGVVTVKASITAVALDRWIHSQPDLVEHLGIRSAALFGLNESCPGEARMTKRIFSERLAEFRHGELNLLVMTRVALEKESDLPPLDFVIEFDRPDTKKK